MNRRNPGNISYSCFQKAYKTHHWVFLKMLSSQGIKKKALRRTIVGSCSRCNLHLMEVLKHGPISTQGWYSLLIPGLRQHLLQKLLKLFSPRLPRRSLASPQYLWDTFMLYKYQKHLYWKGIFHFSDALWHSYIFNASLNLTQKGKGKDFLVFGTEV